MSRLLEVTKMAIGMENSLTELNALAERIDVMYLVGGKFEAEEYLQLLTAVNNQIAMFTSDGPEVPTSPETGDDSTKSETGSESEANVGTESSDGSSAEE